MNLTSSRRVTWSLAAFVAALTLAGAARAADAPPRRTPPPEAFDACQGKTTAEACSVSIRERSMSGSCQPAEDNRLFCRPDRLPPHDPPSPPPEAIEACSGQSAGATCTAAMPGHSVEGTCEASPGGTLGCRPSGPPPDAR